MNSFIGKFLREFAIAREKQEQSFYVPFTKLSYQKLMLKNRKKSFFQNLGRNGENITFDPELVDGCKLPPQLPRCPPDLLAQPLEEIDKYSKNHTCVVINNRCGQQFLYRFNVLRSCFLFHPWNPIRKIAIKISTNQLFDIVVVAVVLIYCIISVIPSLKTFEDYFEFIMIPLFVFELLIQCVAKGVILYPYSHFRSIMNWFDLLVLLATIMEETNIIEQSTDEYSFHSETTGISSLRGFRVFRILKTVRFLPGLRRIGSTLVSSFKMLLDVVLMTLFFMFFYALITAEMWRGSLRNKCVKQVNWSYFYSFGMSVDEYYEKWINTEEHWLKLNDQFVICGNRSGAGTCDNGYVCLQNIGNNPDNGLTGFDNFYLSWLSVFQLITLDNWEALYNKVIRANGSWHVSIFVLIVFFGSYYLINLMLAVVTLNYNSEQTPDNEEKLRLFNQQRKKQKKRGKTVARPIRSQSRNVPFQNNQSNLDFDEKENENLLYKKKKTNTLSESFSEIEGLYIPPKMIKNLNLEKAYLMKDGCIKLILNDEQELMDRNFRTFLREKVHYRWILYTQNRVFEFVATKHFKNFIFVVLGINIMIALLDHHPINTTYAVVDSISEYIFATIFFLECNLKLFGLAKTFFHTGCNIFDLIISYLSMVQLFLPERYHLPMVARKMRLLKITYTWEAFYHLMTEIFKTLSSMVYLSLIILMAVYLFAAFGFQMLENSYESEHFSMVDDIPRWNFNDFWHSMMLVFRIFCGEWVEPLRECLYYKEREKYKCFIVFLPALIIGNLIFLNLFLALLLDSISNNAPQLKSSKVASLLKLITTKFQRRFDLQSEQQSGYSEQPSGFSEQPSGFSEQPSCLSEQPSGFSEKTNGVSKILSGLSEHDCDISDQESGASEQHSSFSQQESIFSKKPIPYSKQERCTLEQENGFSQHQSIFSKKKIPRSEQESGLSQQETGLSQQESCLYKQQSGSYQPQSIFSKKEKQYSKKRSSFSLDKSNTLKQQGNFPEKQTCFSQRQNRYTELQSRFTKQQSHYSVLQSRFSTQRSSYSDQTKKLSDLENSMGFITTDSRGISTLVAENNFDEKKSDYMLSSSGKRKTDDSSDSYKNSSLRTRRKKMQQNKGIGIGITDSELTDTMIEEETLYPCCWNCCWNEENHKHNEKKAYYTQWKKLRWTALKLIRSSSFEYFLLVVIMGSCITLCYEDIYLDEKLRLKMVLGFLNFFFAVVFFVEFLFRCLAMGMKKYFTNFWTIVDFVILFLSWVYIFVGDLSFTSGVKAIRIFRALRPLRTISRLRGLKVLVNSLLHSIPHIANVVIMACAYWLIFSVYGVHLFKGKFYKCIDIDTDRKINSIVIDTKSECQSDRQNYVWVNSKIHFDNVASGLLALLQTATFEGWIEIMEDAIDSVGIDLQPFRENNFEANIYFVVFIAVGSFLFLNLFICVVIDNFSRLREKYQGGYLTSFMTETQRKYYNTLRNISKFKPKKKIERPKGRILSYLYEITISLKLEIAFVSIIFFYLIMLAFESINSSPDYFMLWKYFNHFFIFIFTMEVVIKMVSLSGFLYRPWNVFDVVIVLISIANVCTETANTFDFCVLRIFHIFRLGQILRVYKLAKNLRKLVSALVTSIPELVHVGFLLFIVLFIYAVVGMQLFGKLKPTGVLDEVSNFATFESSILLLIRLSTSGGWNEVLDAMLLDEDSGKCNSTHYFVNNIAKPHYHGECGDYATSIAYMVSFIFIAFFVVSNMYIAIILENYLAAHEYEERGVSEDDITSFYYYWERYDPNATEFISLDQLPYFIADLDEPLGIPLPNDSQILSLDLPLVESFKLHCFDILKALVLRTIGEIEQNEVYFEMNSHIELNFRRLFSNRCSMKIIYTHKQYSLETLACQTLQRAWRQYKAFPLMKQISTLNITLQGKIDSVNTII